MESLMGKITNYYCSMAGSGGQINTNINSIDTSIGIGIELILAQQNLYFSVTFSNLH